MCLIIALAGVHPDAPLVIAANRDEWLARPALPMAVLRAAAPRIIGGRDQLAGGTWLAVNEHGVVAALTNRPSSLPPDATRRSRGELPVLLAGHRTAHEAAAAFAREVRSEHYNACWMLVGDRVSLHSIDLTRPGAPVVEALAPGVHVLENNPLHPVASKARWVTAAVGDPARVRGDALLEHLWRVLGSHEQQPGDADEAYDGGAVRPAATRAACVHAGPYGTRWSAVVRVPAGPGLPDVRFAEGTPCVTPPRSAAEFWATPAPAP